MSNEPIPDDMSDVGAVIMVSLSKKDLAVYEGLKKTIPDDFSEEVVKRRVFRQGLIDWANRRIQEGGHNQ